MTPPLTMATMLASTLRRVGDRYDMERHSELYDAIRDVYLDGGTVDRDAIGMLAKLHRVPTAVAIILRNRAARDRREERLASLPTGAELLADARAARVQPAGWQGRRPESGAESIYDSPGRRTGD